MSDPQPQPPRLRLGQSPVPGFNPDPDALRRKFLSQPHNMTPAELEAAADNAIAAQAGPTGLAPDAGRVIREQLGELTEHEQFGDLGITHDNLAAAAKALAAYEDEMAAGPAGRDADHPNSAGAQVDDLTKALAWASRIMPPRELNKWQARINNRYEGPHAAQELIALSRGEQPKP